MLDGFKGSLYLFYVFGRTEARAFATLKVRIASELVLQPIRKFAVLVRQHLLLHVLKAFAINLRLIIAIVFALFAIWG